MTTKNIVSIILARRLKDKQENNSRLFGNNGDGYRGEFVQTALEFRVNFDEPPVPYTPPTHTFDEDQKQEQNQPGATSRGFYHGQTAVSVNEFVENTFSLFASKAPVLGSNVSIEHIFSLKEFVPEDSPVDDNVQVINRVKEAVKHFLIEKYNSDPTMVNLFSWHLIPVYDFMVSEL